MTACFALKCMLACSRLRRMHMEAAKGSCPSAWQCHPVLAAWLCHDGVDGHKSLLELARPSKLQKRFRITCVKNPNPYSISCAGISKIGMPERLTLPCDSVFGLMEHVDGVIVEKQEGVCHKVGWCSHNRCTGYHWVSHWPGCLSIRSRLALLGRHTDVLQQGSCRSCLQ